MRHKRAYLFISLLFLSQWTTYTTSAVAADTLVIAQCFAPQGNGGNYAATLAWMSETLRLRVQHAAEIEETTGRQVKFHLGCMTGGSSASQVTGIMMNILQNQNLIPGAHTDRLLSLSETRIVADALRFMSLTADAAALEMLNVYRQVILENLEGKVSSSIAKSRLLDRLSRLVTGNRMPAWWDAQTVNADQVLVDFLTTSLLASTMDLELLYGEGIFTGDYESYFQTDYAHYHEEELFPEDRAVHLRRYSSLAEMPRQETDPRAYDNAALDLQRRASSLGARADKFISSLFRFGRFNTRYLHGAYDAPEPLRSIAEQPMGKGFCTITMGALYPSAAEIDLQRLPNYSDLQAIVMCSAETIDALLAQPELISDLQNNPFMGNFVLAEVKNLRGALALGLREPILMSELAGEVGDQRIELVSYFDPRVHTVPERRPFSGEGFAVAGGWPDRRITAWQVSYYLLKTVNRLRGEGYAVQGFMSLFGKPDNRDLDKFDTRSIKTLFSSTPEEAEDNVAEWFEFQDTYCRSFLPRFATESIAVDTVAFNWDISKIPAAQSRKSRLLTSMSINATQLQMNHENDEFVFDAMIDEGFIQDDKAIPCTY